eukprot:14174596-Alexandrium_andersonii.AAC.1
MRARARAHARAYGTTRAAHWSLRLELTVGKVFLRSATVAVAPKEVGRRRSSRVVAVVSPLEMPGRA